MPSSTYWTNSSNVKFSAGTVTDIIFEDGITKIYEPVLKPFKNVVNVKLPSTLTFLAEKAFAACPYSGLCKGFVSLHEITFHHLSPPSALMVIAQSGHIIAHIAQAMQASSSIQTAV